ncbi:MAG: antitoxin [Solirubrobacteraceae bacterium]
MTRTTLDLDTSVLEQLRRRAASERKSMGQVASERLAVGLRQGAPAQAARLRWPTKRMGKPRVDLQDKDALWRALEEKRPEARTP